jgi:hypothetical protein
MRQDMTERLAEWRHAERWRESLAVGSPDWQLAIAEIHRAHSAYRAEVAQAAAQHRELDLAAHQYPWSPALHAAMRSAD